MTAYLQYTYMLSIMNIDEIMKTENNKGGRSPSGKAAALFEFT